MPRLTLRVETARLTNVYGEMFAGPPDRWRLDMAAKLNPYEDRLRLSTGEEMERVTIYANFDCPDDSRRKWLAEKHGVDGTAPVGLLSYQAAVEHVFDGTPATIFFEIHLTKLQMEQAVEFARDGRCPTVIRVDVAEDRGMKYGWEPDGSGKEWDTKEHPRIAIKGVAFDIPAFAAEPETEELPSGGVVSLGIADLLPVLNKISLMIGWVALGVAILVALFLLRR